MDFKSLLQTIDTIKESVQQPAVQVINDFDEVVAEFDNVPKGFRDNLRSSEFDAVQWLADVMKKDPDFDITTIEKIVLRPGVYGSDEHVIDVTKYLDGLDESIHKGTYGTSYGKEDVRDQYGHRVGKVNKGAETKKDEPKKGRGRPKKGAGTSGEHKTYDTATLGSVFGGGKKPSKEIGKKSVKHSLKEYIEEAESALNEDASVGVKPLPGASEITMNNEPTGITAKDPQSATKIKDLMATGSISMPGSDGDSSGVNNSLGEDGFDDEHTGHDPAEYGMEGDFVKTQLHTIKRSTQDLEERLSDQEDLPEWVEMKISQAQGMLASVSDYMDSQHERDVERETGEEGVVNEKAKSKAQQRFFGMVHAMQQGKKVPGASKELKNVAKGIGKSDAEDFAKTKHKGLPQHVKKTNETSFEDQGVVETAVEESGLQAYLGNKKYGKDGMDALRKAGQENASEKKMQNIRAKYSNKEDVAEDGEKWIQKAIKHPGALTKKAKAAGQSTQAFAKAHAHDKGKTGKQARLAQTLSKMHEGKEMKTTQLTEGAMKDLLINFHSDVTSHMGDGSMFDLKKAKNVQQAEEILKALVKHGDEYEGLNITNQNELVSQAMKYLAHEKELPFNSFVGIDKQRFATRTPADLSKFRQHPATPTSLFNRPGNAMAVPRTTPTIKESNDMKDKQFESWEQELNSLLTEGITVSHSTGQQGSPDSLSINATEHDASELMSILRNSGMEMFGGSKEQTGGYGAPEHGGDEGGEEFHQGVDIAPSPEVVGDGDDMLALIKKMSGIGSDAGTPGSVEIDYEDEEGSGEEGHDDTCDDCGHSPCSCDDEGEEHNSGEDSEEDEVDEAMYDEGNEFSGELAKAKAQHKDHFSVDGKEYPVKEDDMEEGNMFTGNLAKARAQGKSEADLDGDGDMEKVREGEEECNECGYPMESCGCDHVEEGYSNDAGGDAMGDTELLSLKELLGRGNDLHRQKHTQATGNIQKVTMETKLLKDTTNLLTDWQKLSGIK